MEKGFFKRVYEVVSKIPTGKVITYGQIAGILGMAKGARIVGYAMRIAPDHLPNHRVVNKQGEMARENIFGGEGIQRKRLEKEGVTFLETGCIDMERHVWVISEESF